MTAPVIPPAYADIDPLPRLLMGPGPINADPRVLCLAAVDDGVDDGPHRVDGNREPDADVAAGVDTHPLGRICIKQNRIGISSSKSH